MELDLKRLHQVLTVARLGSFSRAAEELHITQPALSRSVAVLEERHGMRIFERGRSGAVLTELGKLVVSEAENLLREARSLEHNLRLYAAGEGGAIAFGMGPLLASMLLPALSVHFINTLPHLKLRSVVQSASALYEELTHDRIEMLFCGGEQLSAERDVVSEMVGLVSRSVVVRAGHPLVGRPHISTADLKRYTLLSAVDVASRGAETFGRSFICDNYHILRQTVMETDAVWMASEELVAGEVEAGILCMLAVSDDPLENRLPVNMVSRRGNRLSPAALAIRDFVRSRLQPVG